MRLLIVTFAAILLLVTPAEAEWKQYVYSDIGCALDFPANPTITKGAYKGLVAGTPDAAVYSVIEPDIAYKMTVVDFRKRADEGATLIGEAIYLTSQTGHVVSDETARVEPMERAIYGRRLVVDLLNGGRTMTTLYFTKGRLYMLQAAVPAGGDKNSPDLARFTFSLAFDLTAVGRP